MDGLADAGHPKSCNARKAECGADYGQAGGQSLAGEFLTARPESGNSAQAKYCATNEDEDLAHYRVSSPSTDLATDMPAVTRLACRRISSRGACRSTASLNCGSCRA